MAKPRVFVSSTYYDLKHIRASLEGFIQELGYEPILFESGDIPFHHDQPLDVSCYDAVASAHIFVLIIGGRYGSSASGSKTSPANKSSQPTTEELEHMYAFYNSITVEEYRMAREQDVPIYIFLEKAVSAEYQTYKENKDSTTIRYAHVDNVSVFRLLDTIFAEQRNNLVREFETFAGISHWLKEQWAGLFADYLGKRKSDTVLADLSTQVETLNQVADALKSYSEVILRKVEPDVTKSAKVIKAVEDKLARQLVASNTLIKHLKRTILPPDADLDNFDRLAIDATAKSGQLVDFYANLEFSEEQIERLRRYHAEATRDFLILRKQLSEIAQLTPLFADAPPVVQEIMPRRRIHPVELSDQPVFSEGAWSPHARHGVMKDGERTISASKVKAVPATERRGTSASKKKVASSKVGTVSSSRRAGSSPPSKSTNVSKSREDK